MEFHSFIEEAKETREEKRKVEESRPSLFEEPSDKPTLVTVVAP